MTISRRTLLKGIGAAPAAVSLFSIPQYAHAAEITLRYGNNLPLSHPLNIRAKEAADRIAKETNGRVEMLIFPANQLGGDTDMLSQVRNGALTFFTPSALVIATLVPVAAINAVGFAFKDYNQVWAAMDGPVGAFVRKAIADSRLHALETMWDNGFRQMTTSGAPIQSADSMKGLKIRVPVSPISISMFSGLGASPASLQFSEVYTALQTKVVDAQENPLPTIEAKKFYEVQKNISLTGHIVDSLLTIVSGQLWGKLSADEKKIFAEVMQEAAEKTGREIIASETRLVEEFKKKGNNVITVDKNAFREAVLKNTKPTDHGYRQQDYDRITAIK